MMRVAAEQLCELRLRIVATTDLHANLLAWDYFLDRPAEGQGLARVATLLRQARQEVPNCLYFDNGDLIEGSPLSEYAHQQTAPPAPAHPMLAALNALDCDAATLGNHEFSYGLPYLQSVLRDAAHPVVCANISATQGADGQSGDTLFQPWVLLDRQFADETGRLHSLRVGVLGLTPPQVLDWEKVALQGRVRACGMAETAARHVPLMRAAGADIVVILAHTGIGGTGGATENEGLRLAEVPDVDALVLGHEHQVFPVQAGATLAGVPAVMPGAFGSHLGVIDLALSRASGRWRVNQSHAECRPIAGRGARGEAVALVPDDLTVAKAAQPSHEATRAWVARRVGQTDVALHSYFSVVQPDAMQALIAAAQARFLAEMLAGTPWEGLPVLSSAAPFKAGGRGGPENFTDVPAGPLFMRNAADLYLHPNRFAALAITGAGLREWLERAVTAYAPVLPGKADQPLLHPMYPVTSLEMIAGLSYRIDLSAPPAFTSPIGKPTGQPGRIRDMCHNGRPVPPDMRFALATNSYRVGVLSGLAGAAMPEVIADGTASPTNREVLLRHLAGEGGVPHAVSLDWAFAPMPGASVVLETAPAACNHMAEITRFRPEVLGLTDTGFLRFRLHL